MAVSTDLVSFHNPPYRWEESAVTPELGDCGMLELEPTPGSGASWKGEFVGKDMGPQEAGSGF